MDNNIADFHDIHCGKRAFIIGNGPSLKIEYLDLLKGEITFGVNKIYLAYDQTDWRPTYYGVEDKMVMIQNFDRIKSLDDSIKFFSVILNRWVPVLADSYYFNLKVEQFYPGLPGFSYNASEMIYWGSTIVYSMLQLAVYMGIREIYLIGMDMDITVPDTRDYEDQNILISQGEQNHFHPNYRTPGEKWFIPNLHVSKKSFQKADMAVKEIGGKVYNATNGGKLEAFERVSFAPLFQTEAESAAHKKA